MGGDKMQWAVIAVTVAALVFVVYSSMLLTKIARCTEEGTAGLKELLVEIRAEIHGFRFASTQLSNLAERTAAVLSRLELSLKTSGPVVTVSPEFVEFAQNGIDVLHSVAETTDDSLLEWAKENRADLRRLFVQKNQMEKELDALREKVHASECKVVDLRRKALSADEAEQSAVRLQTQNQRLLVDVREARRRLLEAEQQYEPMKQELQQAKARLAALSRTNTSVQGGEESAAGVGSLRQRISELEAELARCQALVLARDEELSRTLREKSLIEERFLEDENR